jgi:hypothetical protein
VNKEKEGVAKTGPKSALVKNGRLVKKASSLEPFKLSK